MSSNVREEEHHPKSSGATPSNFAQGHTDTIDFPSSHIKKQKFNEELRIVLSHIIWDSLAFIN